MDETKIVQQARDFFLSGRFPELLSEDVVHPVSRVSRETRRGRVYFEASKRMRGDHSAHYMLYGSEFISGVALHLLEKGCDYRKAFITAPSTREREQRTSRFLLCSIAFD